MAAQKESQPAPLPPHVRLRRIREEVLGVTQAKFAEMLGCSRVNVAMWESGAYRPGIDNLAAIERLTGIPASSWARRSAPVPAAEVGHG